MARSGTGTALVSADVGDGGLRAGVERLVLRDGSVVAIGLLETADEAWITSWFTRCFAGLGAERLYARLFVLLEWLDRVAPSAVTAVDGLRLGPVAAFAPDGVAVGIARCLPVTDAASAEVTVAVAEAWQGRGIATALLERVAARARSIDIEKLTARCPARDRTLIRLLSRLGPITIEPSDIGLVNVRIDVGSAPERRAVSAGRREMPRSDV